MTQNMIQIFWIIQIESRGQEMVVGLLGVLCCSLENSNSDLCLEYLWLGCVMRVWRPPTRLPNEKACPWKDPGILHIGNRHSCVGTCQEGSTEMRPGMGKSGQCLLLQRRTCCKVAGPCWVPTPSMPVFIWHRCTLEADEWAERTLVAPIKWCC